MLNVHWKELNIALSATPLDGQKYLIRLPWQKPGFIQKFIQLERHPDYFFHHALLETANMVTLRAR